MKRYFSVFVIFLFCSAIIFPVSSKETTTQETIWTYGSIIYENELGWLHIDGRHIKDESGNMVRLRGVNIVFYNPADWWQGKLDLMFNDKLETLGINVIRLAIQMAYYPTYSTDIDWIVNWSKQRGIRVIIDLHSLPPAPTDYPFPPSIPSGWFENETAGEKWIQWWENVVTHYKDEPTVCGIGLLNEPNNVLSQENLLKWKIRTEECVRRVKAINPNIIPFVSGPWAMNYWSSDQISYPIFFFQQDPDFEYEVVFETHMYPYHMFYENYQYFGSFQFMEYYLAGDYETGWIEMQRQLEDPISSPDWEGHWGVFGLGELPIFVGETGYNSQTEEYSDGGLPDDVQRQVMLDLIRWFNKHQIHYTVWVWMNPFVGGSWDIVGLPPEYEETWMYTTVKNELLED